MANILLTGTEAWAIEAAQRELELGGHEVVVSNDPLLSANPGACLAEQLKPLDLAITVRAHPLVNVTRREACLDEAFAAGLPVMVAGSIAPNPFHSLAPILHPGLDGIAEHAAAYAA